jgi:hypothetical protein
MKLKFQKHTGSLPHYNNCTYAQHKKTSGQQMGRKGWKTLLQDYKVTAKANCTHGWNGQVGNLNDYSSCLNTSTSKAEAYCRQKSIIGYASVVPQEECI